MKCDQLGDKCSRESGWKKGAGVYVRAMHLNRDHTEMILELGPAGS